MKKNELISEIKKMVESEGWIKYADKWFRINWDDEVLMHHHNERYVKYVKYMTKDELERYLGEIKEFISNKNNDDENVAEPTATKKDNIMGLHKNGWVKCNLATAESLATEGFINIESYEDGVLYAEINYDNVCEDLIYDDEIELFNEVRNGEFGHCYIDQVTDWYDMGYLKSIEYGGDGMWYCELDWNGILIDFCNRWEN